MEKELRVKPGGFVRQASHFAEEAGEWSEHLPYGLAVEYYEKAKVRSEYGSHVDGCSTCQRLLETLHPSDLQAGDFAKTAARAHRYASRSTILPAACGALAALVVCGIGALVLLPARRTDVVAAVPKEQAMIVRELRAQPSTLVRLESSDKPIERYRAARVYFAADKPDLAWQQIGEGLELAGVTPVTAQRITNAANVPSEESAAALATAAQRLHALQMKLNAAGQVKDPTLYLESAELQAKLGLNADALKSIQQYLEATKANPKALDDFSKAALAKSPALVATNP